MKTKTWDDRYLSLDQGDAFFSSLKLSSQWHSQENL